LEDRPGEENPGYGSHIEPESRLTVFHPPVPAAIWGNIFAICHCRQERSNQEVSAETQVMIAVGNSSE